MTKEEFNPFELEKQTVTVNIPVTGYRKKRGIQGVLIPWRASHVLTYLVEDKWTELGTWSNRAIVAPPIGVPKPIPGGLITVNVKVLTDDSVKQYAQHSYGLDVHSPNSHQSMTGIPGSFRTHPTTTPECKVVIYFLEGTDFERTVTVDNSEVTQ